MIWFSLTSISPYKDRQPFAGTDDKPSTVTYYQQRQIFANTNNEPQVLHLTQTADYRSLRTSRISRDDDAISQTIAAQQVNEIRHLVPLDAILTLTSSGEWIVTDGQDRVLTPSTMGMRPQSGNGSSWVRPVVINDTAIYVQEKGSKVREFGYTFNKGNFIIMLSIINSIKSPFKF